MTRDERAAAIEAAAREVVESKDEERFFVNEAIEKLRAAIGKLSAAEVTPEPALPPELLRALRNLTIPGDAEVRRLLYEHRLRQEAAMAATGPVLPATTMSSLDAEVAPGPPAEDDHAAVRRRLFDNPSAQARIAELEAEVARLRLTSLCGVCMGFPHDHPSGLPCICGGSGLAKDEGLHARELNGELRRRGLRLLRALKPFATAAYNFVEGFVSGVNEHQVTEARDAYNEEKNR